ncbi:MAG: hypothetical protein KAV87_68250 [Desulfobacteraceae bacterium]|nr:hypothetical protein [Desulfobacteraceae bacterium]
MKDLENIWVSLVVTREEPQSAPPLGYRGCLVVCDSAIEWLAYKNWVTHKSRSMTESRYDRYRKFEKLVIASAPKGLVPLSLIENERGQTVNSDA